MKITRLVVLGLLCGASGAVLSQDTPASIATQRADTDSRAESKLTTPEFVKKAGAAGMAEVEMGKLGAQKATNSDVKAFAQRMVKDHTKANKELQAAATAAGVEVPSSPDMMHKAVMEKFKLHSADAEFDRAFMQQMVGDHEKVVALFESASQDMNVSADLRAWAQKTLPTLQEHLQQAKSLDARLAKYRF